MGTAFSANDHPVYARELNLAEVFQKQFDGQEMNAGGGVPRRVNTLLHPRDNIVSDLFQRPFNPVAVRSGQTRGHARDADVLQTLDEVEVGCGAGGNIKALELASHLVAFLSEQRDQPLDFLDEVDFAHVGIDDGRQRIKTVPIAGSSPRRSARMATDQDWHAAPLHRLGKAADAME